MRYLDEQDAWYNWENGLLFSKIDLFLLQSGPSQGHAAYASEVVRQPAEYWEVMDLATHEQYFWSFYKNYMADHAKAGSTRRSALFMSTGYKAIFPEEDPYEQVRDRV